MTDLKLAGEFPPAHREDWLKLVKQALKGAPLDETLVARTYDGLRIEALSERAAEAHAIAGARGAAPWQVLQRVDHPDPAQANAQALEDLANGASGLALVFAGSVGSHGWGIDGSEATLARALDGVYLDAGIAIELDLSPQYKDAGQRDRLDRQEARHRAGFHQYPLRLRSPGRNRPGRREPGALDRTLQGYSPPPSPAWPGKASAGRSRWPTGA